MRLPRKTAKARLELLPLMDVIFIVLIFLVYAIINMVVNRGLPVNLPYSEKAVQMEEAAITLSITENGDLFLDDMAVTARDLCAGLEKSGKKEETLQIYAAASLPYQKLYSTLDLLKECGVTRISLQAKAK